MTFKLTNKTIVGIMILGGMLAASCAQADMHVFACEPEWAALAGEIGGDRIKVTAATNALQDPHFIQARPSLIAGVRKADLLICSGAGLETGWLPLLLRKGNNPKIQRGQPGNLMASDFVKRLEVPTSLDRSQGDLHAQGNPHIQTDPRNLLVVARVIAERLQQIDAANATVYAQSFAAFNTKWSAAITKWQQQAAPLRGKKIVVHHKSWAYLENWLGLVEVAQLESKPGVPPSAAHLNTLLGQLKANSAALIIRTAYQSPKPSEWLTAQTGIANAALPFTVGGNPQANDLYGLFDSTVSILLTGMEYAHD